MKKEPVVAPKILTTSVRFLAAIGGIAMMSTGECEIIFMGLFISFFLMGMKLESFPVLWRIMGALQPYFAALVFCVAVLDFLYLSNSFLLSVAHFLLSLQGLRVLALRTNRENLGSILLSSMMMLSASTLAVDWTYFVLLIGFLALAIWTLMIYTVLEENQAAAGPQGQTALREKTLLWRQLLPVIRWSTLGAFLLAGLCCALVFLTFPRFNFQGFRGQFLQPVRKTGFTNQVELGKSGRIFVDESVVMRVEIDPQDRDKWTGYMRGRALEVYDGRVWKDSSETPRRLFTSGRRQMHVPFVDERPGELIKQSIYLESMDSPLLFAVPRPARLKIDRLYLDHFSDGAIQRGNNDAWRLHYQVDSYVSQLDPAVAKKRASRPVMGGEEEHSSHQDELLALPGGSAELRALAASVTQGARTDLEKCEKIAAYLRTRYQYSLQFPALQEDKTPVDQFLFDVKKGHCEYFAAAMCLMLRAQKIPARMVTGFISQEWNSRGSYYVVRMKNAHAWVEADVKPYGWAGFDPSPRDVSEGFAESGMVRRYSEMMDYLNLRWNRYILSYDFERQVAIVRTVTQQSGKISTRLGALTSFSQRVKDWFQNRSWPGRSLGADQVSPLWGQALAVVLLVGCVVALWFIGRGIFRRHNRVWFYPRLKHFLERRSGRKIVTQTLQEFFDSEKPRFRNEEAEAKFLISQYYRFRFDPDARPSHEDDRNIRLALKKL